MDVYHPAVARVPLIDFEVDIYFFDLNHTKSFQISALNSFSAVYQIIKDTLHLDEAASFANISIHVKRARP